MLTLASDDEMKRNAVIVALVLALVGAGVLLLHFRQASRRNECHNHLRMIHAAIVSSALADHYRWGHEIPVDVFSQYLPPKFFQCPSGGEYTMPAVGGHPTCTVHGDLLQQSGDLDGAPSPKERGILGNPYEPLSKMAAVGIACRAMGVDHLDRDWEDLFTVFPPDTSQQLWRIEYADPLGDKWQVTIDAKTTEIVAKSRESTR